MKRIICISVLAVAMMIATFEDFHAQKEVWTNNGASTLASGITNSATSLTVQSGHGARFPAITGSNYFYVTLEDNPVTKREIVKVTARSTDTFTIVRAQQGTTGQAFSSGDKVEQRLTADTLNVLQARAPILKYVTANAATTSTTFVDVADLTFPVTAGVWYFDCNLQHFASATTVQPHISINGPTATTINYQLITATSATAFHASAQTAYDTVTNQGTGITTPGGPAQLFGALNLSASGNVIVRQKAEVAGTVTMVRGSYCRFFQ